MYRTSLHYGSYQYPVWGKGLGVCMGAFCCLQIPIWAIVAVWKESGTMTDVSLHLWQTYDANKKTHEPFFLNNETHIHKLCFSVSSSLSALPESHPAAELLARQQPKQWHSGAERRTWESGRTLHRQPDQYWLHCDGLGVEWSVTLHQHQLKEMNIEALFMDTRGSVHCVGTKNTYSI